MAAIEKQLQDYVAILSEDQKKTILNVAKALAPDAGSESDWEDENFVAEVNNQSKAIRQSNVPTSSPGNSRTGEPNNRP